VAALVAVAGVAGAPPRQAAALDPRSTAGDGAKAMVLLLEHFGTRVDPTTALPGPGVGAAVLLADRLDDQRRADLSQWVDDGGLLVVADPSSPLMPSAPVSVGNGLLEVSGTVPGPCPAAALDDVASIDPGATRFLRLPNGAIGCFPAGRRSPAFALVEVPMGRGRLYALGGAGLFTNRLLGHADNGVLAVDLLAPHGEGAVAFLLPSTVGGGHKSLASLLPRRVKLALVQLLIAFAVLVLWRVRRLGRPVPEGQPVELAGSELVVAVGHLFGRTGRRDAAAFELRRDLRRWLAQRSGLPPSAPADALAGVAAARWGIDGGRLESALGDLPVATDADLVALAQALDRIREEVMHAGA
jgi:hypothetical protein